VNQDCPETFSISAGLLNLKSLVKALLINNIAFKQLFTKKILDSTGSCPDHLSETKDDNPLPPLALKSKNPGFSTETDYLQYLAKP
jgi:hypothetical protein